MVLIEDEMEPMEGYLIHFGTTGQKKGLRRYQSYAVAPTRSGMVGDEVGEAAKQRVRVESDRSEHKEIIRDGKRIYKSPDELRNASQLNNYTQHDRYQNSQQQQRMSDKDVRKMLKQKAKDDKKAKKLEAEKDKLSKDYKTLYKNRDKFTTEELKERMYRLDKEGELKRKMHHLNADVTKDGANVLKNILGGGLAIAGMYNLSAESYNAYNKYNGIRKTPLPTLNLKFGSNKNKNK